MPWVIFIAIILITLILIFILNRNNISNTGFKSPLYYAVIALMVVLLIISIVAWYTATVNPKLIKKPPVGFLINN